jgi:hypothetical protein
MGFLSTVPPLPAHVSKPQNADETFYGTSLAGRDVCYYEMGEDEVCAILLLCVKLIRCPARSLPETPIAISKTNVSERTLPPFLAESLRHYLVLMDGTPALNLASFVTTYMQVIRRITQE